jgi:hypothetical protein
VKLFREGHKVSQVAKTLGRASVYRALADAGLRLEPNHASARHAVDGLNRTPRFRARLSGAPAVNLPGVLRASLGTQHADFEFLQLLGRLGRAMPDGNSSTTATPNPPPSWNSVVTIPLGVPLWLRVTDAAGECYKLPFPCKLTQAGWINARTGAPLRLIVQPTHWRPHFELEGGKAPAVAPAP